MQSALEAAWATEERPNKTSMSQDDLITEFHKLDALVKEQGALRREIGMQLAGIAYENKAEQNTVHLVSTGGQRIKVEFGIDYEYETEQMMTVADLLGKEAFDSLFKTKVEFIPKKRELKKFMNTVASDEKTKTAKQIIADATVTKDKTQYISVE